MLSASIFLENFINIHVWNPILIRKIRDSLGNAENRERENKHLKDKCSAQYRIPAGPQSWGT